jgi:GR25 family glycosyltransferase involved in LPS biosynthesis
MVCKGFILHLARATGRAAQAEAMRSALPIDTEILPAVDGLQMSDTEARRFVRTRMHEPHYPFDLSKTEIACFLTHRRAWQAIIDAGCDAGLIVEDDAAVASGDFEGVVGAALRSIRPDEFIRFPHRERHEPGTLVRSAGPARFIEPRLPCLGMVMQLVGREAARRLLDASWQFDRPVDNFVQMQWLHTARVLTARPIVVREICQELGGSVIHRPQPGVMEKVFHELQRPLIRLAIRQANDQWRRKSA